MLRIKLSKLGFTFFFIAILSIGSLNWHGYAATIDTIQDLTDSGWLGDKNNGFATTGDLKYDPVAGLTYLNVSGTSGNFTITAGEQNEGGEDVFVGGVFDLVSIDLDTYLDSRQFQVTVTGYDLLGNQVGTAATYTTKDDDGAIQETMDISSSNLEEISKFTVEIIALTLPTPRVDDLGFLNFVIANPKLADDTAPVFQGGTPLLSDIAKDQATLHVQLDEAGTAYYVVVADGASAPSAAQVKAGQNSSGGTVTPKGSIAVSAASTDTTGTIDLSGLSSYTDYDVYVVAEDSVPNLQADGQVQKLDFRTIAEPTDIVLSSATVKQSQSAPALVGTLSTVDLDIGDTFTYTKVSEAGTDNDKFSIGGPGNDQLFANDPSVMPAGDYTVKIETKDSYGEKFQKVFTITVEDDVAPTFPIAPVLSGITASSATLTVQLNEPGTAYYVVVADDAVAPSAAQVKVGQNSSGGTVTLKGSITVGTADTDATGTIDLSGLSPHTDYDVYVVAVDGVPNLQGAATKVDLTTFNSAPTGITLDSATVNQSLGTDALVGTLKITDADDDEASGTYALNGSAGDNDLFKIEGQQLKAKDAGTMAAGTYTVEIKATDPHLGEVIKTLTITVADDVAPTFPITPALSGITASSATLTVQLNEPGTAYYVVVADDAVAPSAAQVKAGQNSDGDSASPNGTITVSAADTDATGTIDLSSLSPHTDYDVYVVAEDDVPNLQGAATKVDLTTFNSAPTGITLDSATVNQSLGTDALVGTLKITDADDDEASGTYALNGSAGDNDLFKIEGQQLKAKDAGTMAAGTYTVEIKATDPHLGEVIKTLTITVADDVAPTFPITPALSGITASSATLTVQLNEPGTAYYVVVADGASAPSAAQVKVGQNSDGDSASPNGTITVSAAGTDATGTIDLSSLSPHTDYDVYVVAVDGVPNLQGAATKVDLTTFNSAPTGITLDSATVNQSLGSDALVGTLAITDADDDEASGTYALNGSAGDNDLFKIEGQQLKAKDAGTMAAGTYTVEIKATDPHLGEVIKTLTITVADDVAPTFPITPALSGITASSATLTVQLNEPGTAYYVVVADDAVAPSAAQVKAGQNSDGVGVLPNGTITVSAAGTDATGTIDLSSLSPHTDYDVHVVAEDGVPNLQGTATKVGLTTFNSAPTGITLDSATVNQSLGTDALVGTLAITDADDDEDSGTYTLNGSAGDNDLFKIEGQQLKALDAATMTAGTYTVEIKATDPHLGEVTKTLTVTVVDDVKPVFTSASTPNVNENTTSVITIEATDVGDGTDLAYAISGGEDADKFNFDGASRELTFKIAPDYEHPEDEGKNNQYEVTIEAKDAANNTATQTITVTVQDVNDNAPVITSNANIDVNENTTAVTTVTAEDADSGTTLTYSKLSGLDADKFDFDPSTHVLTFHDAPDFELPTDGNVDNVYEVTIQVDDGVHQTQQTISVTVKDANERPQVSDSTVSGGQEDTAVTFNSTSFTFFDVDGGTFSKIRIESLPANGDLTLSGSAVALHQEIDVSQLADFLYQPDEDWSGTDSFDWSGSDGDLYSDSSATITLNIAAVNDAPVAQDVSAATDVDASVSGSLSATDVEGDSLTYSIVDQGTKGDLVIVDASTGAYTYTPLPGVYGSDEITYQAYDGALSSNTASLHVTIAPSDNAELSSLQTSDGDLVPALQPLVYNYSVNVANSVNHITVTASTYNAYATLKVKGVTVANATASDPIDLHVGSNTIHIEVTAQDGSTIRDYYLTVNRKGDSSGSDSTGSTGQTRIVDVGVVDGQQLDIAVQVEITRTVNDAGKKVDQVALDKDKTAQVVAMAVEEGRHAARILIDDLPDDPADIVTVNVTQESLQLFSDNKLSLEIETIYGRVAIPATSLFSFTQGGGALSFKIVPVLKPEEQQSVIERVIHSEFMQHTAGHGKIHVWGTPVGIEASGYHTETNVIFPLEGMSLPEGPDALARFLNSLGVYVEHSDGTREWQWGQIQYGQNGRPSGIAIHVDKFSTFTVVEMEGIEQHEAYISGYSDGAFRPNRPITRAEMASIAARWLDGSGADSVSLPDDVPGTHWAAGAIKKAMAAHLMIGDETGAFRPNDPITRAEMAVIITKWKQAPLSQTTTGFTDIRSHWAEPYIHTVAGLKIMSGYPDGTFRPDQSLTRAEAVATVNRLLGRGPLGGETAPTWSDVPPDFWAYRDIQEASIDHRSVVQEDGSEKIVQDTLTDPK